SRLSDIPQATLYRQLDILVKADILLVTEQNQVRGAIEKTYELNTGAAVVSNEEAMKVSKEDHLKHFMLFAVNLARNFEDYLEKGPADFERDGVGYRQLALQLSDEEF